MSLFRYYIRNKPVLYLSLLLTFFGASCDPSRVFEKNLHIADGIWDNQTIAEFEVNISDTIELHNIYLNVRHSTDYKYNNLYLFVDSYYPDGNRSRDTIECILAAVDGKWFGKGLGEIKENQILLNRGVCFPLKGIYCFSFEQAMREDILEGIEDIGIRIERMSEN